MSTERVERSVTATAAESQRARWAAEAMHSGEMEGLPVTQAMREDTAEYVAGLIDEDQMVARARARYGLA